MNRHDLFSLLEGSGSGICPEQCEECISELDKALLEANRSLDDRFFDEHANAIRRFKKTHRISYKQECGVHLMQAHRKLKKTGRRFHWGEVVCLAYDEMHLAPCSRLQLKLIRRSWKELREVPSPPRGRGKKGGTKTIL